MQNTLLKYEKKNMISKFTHIAGAGGNGKTEFIVKLAKSYFGLCFIAPTSTAVKNLIDRGNQLNIKIEAMTYHKAFGFGCREMNRSNYKKFILDECSMVNNENLQIMLSKLNKTQSFLMSGDFCQLQCIEGKLIYDNWTKKKSEEYKKFEIIELTENFRQKTDPEFFSLCNSLRNPLTKDDALEIINVLNNRYVKKLPYNNTLDDIHICGINKQVNDVNAKYKMIEGSKIISTKKQFDSEKKTIPNGAIGIIIKNNTIKWNDNTISIFKNEIKTPNFALAYGLTVHKAQGATLKNNVIINPTRLFSKNHLYVALTRATKFSSIYFTNKINMKVFSKTCNVN